MESRRRDLITLKSVRLQVPSGWGAPSSRQVDLRLWLDLGEAAFHDRIERTVDYREVHRRVLAAAARGGRDLAAGLARVIMEGFPQVDEVEVALDGGPRARLTRGEDDGATH